MNSKGGGPFFSHRHRSCIRAFSLIEVLVALALAALVLGVLLRSVGLERSGVARVMPRLQNLVLASYELESALGEHTPGEETRDFYPYPQQPGEGDPWKLELKSEVTTADPRLEQVTLGGVSLGGWIAAEFAVRWPERVKKLWLSGTPGLWVDEEPLPDLFRYTDGREASRDRIRELLFHDPNGAMAKIIIADQPDEDRMLQAYQSMTALARLMWERPYSPKLPKRLYRVQCPVLLVK